jgi:hypothetical protein
MIFAGVFVLLAVALISVRARESGHPDALFWVDVAFISTATLVAVAAAFRRSWRQLRFWLALATIVGAQAGAVLEIAPASAHVPAIWGSLVAYGEFIVVSGLLSKTRVSVT